MCRISWWPSIILAVAHFHICPAQEQQAPSWQYSAVLLQPFWESDVMRGESVLFLRSADDGEARGSVLFPVEQVLSVKNAAGDITYEEGKDYSWTKNSREIVLPAKSRIVSSAPADLLRPV